jgi:hypothetical protein
MKYISIAIAMIITVSVASADELTPLADFPIGTNMVSGEITLTTTNSASLWTDTGPRQYTIILPPKTAPANLIGKQCLVEAVIEKDDTSNWTRRFRIKTIKLKNQKKK